GGMTFFCSSRSRHTRFSRAWSSDVCSSDLMAAAGSGHPAEGNPRQKTRKKIGGAAPLSKNGRSGGSGGGQEPDQGFGPRPPREKIGRASCRERAMESGHGEAAGNTHSSQGR